MPRSLYGDIFRMPSKEEVRDFLIGVPLFGGLKKKEVSHLAKLMYKRQFKKGEVVFVEGDVGSAMYIVLEGRVSIIKSRGKTLKEVACLSSGSFFGEMALLTDEKRSATAKVTTKTTLLCFFKKDLDHILHKDPAVGLHLMRNLSSVLARRLKHMIERMEDK